MDGGSRDTDCGDVAGIKLTTSGLGLSGGREGSRGRDLWGSTSGLSSRLATVRRLGWDLCEANRRDYGAAACGGGSLFFRCCQRNSCQ
ncbi:hypothetical protein TIFTF001_002383 [Ficus carica]|uniref:Uncharacterized protein n=1 Tax=Ficus carica TaxID=3494 RepID=A0AA88CT94_FICCA|nr:hypothetical protein TIFTF001_002383 [Ficus carica]